jgi:hypothetical protein
MRIDPLLPIAIALPIVLLALGNYANSKKARPDGAPPAAAVPAKPPESLAPQVRPLLDRAHTAEERLKILDGLFKQTPPERCVLTIEDFLKLPPGRPAEAIALRAGLLKRLGSYAAQPHAVEVLLAWTGLDKIEALRLAALDAIGSARSTGSLPQGAEAQLQRLATTDPSPNVKARAKAILGLP